MPFHLAEELMELLGGVLGNDALAQCELLAASESSRVLMADVARALREGRAEAVPRKDSAAFEAMSDLLNSTGSLASRSSVRKGGLPTSLQDLPHLGHQLEEHGLALVREDDV